MSIALDSYAHAHTPTLSRDQLASRAPAAFADRPAANTSSSYVFISTQKLVDALLEAGFVATAACQTSSRRGSDPAFARHMLRFQHSREAVALVDAIPQIALINAHDGTSSYELRAGLYRPICTNGLLTALGDFGLVHIPHRGNVVRNVVDAALAMVRDFAKVGKMVQRMAALTLTEPQRLQFAQQALAIRYPNGRHQPIDAAQILTPRRDQDRGDDLWRTLNVIQESCLKGGTPGHSAGGRASATRSIRAIREDVRINHGLWQLATALLPA